MPTATSVLTPSRYSASGNSWSSMGTYRNTKHKKLITDIVIFNRGAKLLLKLRFLWNLKWAFFSHLYDFVELKKKNSIKSVILVELNVGSCNKCTAQIFFIIGFQSYFQVRIICKVLCTLNIYSFICQLHPGGSGGKESASNARGLGLVPGWRRSPGEGIGNPLQYSCLEIP